MATIKTGWLKDNSGDKFAPKTLSSQVVSSDGTTLESVVQAKFDEINALIENGGIDPDHSHVVEDITDIDDYYYDKTYIDANLATKDEIKHNHDEVYAKIGDSYTKDEMDSNFALKSELDHNHDLVYAKIDDVYTKAEEDAFLAKKLDTETYTAGIEALKEKIATDIETHNISTAAHADIRTEVAAKVAKADIVTDLATSDDTKVLAASQGATLKTELDELTTGLGNGTVVVNTATKLNSGDVGDATQPIYFKDGQPATTTYALDLAGENFGLVKSGGDVTIKDGVITVNDDSHNHIIDNVDGLQNALDTKVPQTRTINGESLESDITLDYAHVGALSDTDPVGAGTLSIGRVAEVITEGENGEEDKSNIGANSIALGLEVEASGIASFAEGYATIASNEAAHAEGYLTKAGNNYSHAEGQKTQANGIASHAEGYETKTVKAYSHAEGFKTVAEGGYAHSEGSYTTANGESSHAEGSGTLATGDYSHSEGYRAIALGQSSHAEGKSDIKSYLNYTFSTSNDDIITDWYNSYFSLAKGTASHVEGSNCLALGNYSHAEGQETIASGLASHAEGGTEDVDVTTTASGDYSHAEGETTTASGRSSHSEGCFTTASGKYSHIEGESTYAASAICDSLTDDEKIIEDWDKSKFSLAKGQASHVEGFNNLALGTYGHAEGFETQATGYASHVEGNGATASGTSSHAEGYKTDTQGDCSHAEGYKTSVGVSNANRYSDLGISTIGYAAHAEGYGNVANGVASHAEGMRNNVTGYAAHAEGYDNDASGDYSHSQGCKTTALGTSSHAEGFSSANAPSDCSSLDNDAIVNNWNSATAANKFSLAKGHSAHVEGVDCLALGKYSHAEGEQTKATGQSAHAEGRLTEASGNFSHAEGSQSKASGDYSHAEGDVTTAIGDYSHAEGENTFASGRSSHSEGRQTSAGGDYGHAEGQETRASGDHSHAEGKNTAASGECSHAEGKSTEPLYKLLKEINPNNDTILTKWSTDKFSLAKGEASHAEGIDCLALGDYSHAEGQQTIASGSRSHGEGYSCEASGDYSHAEGCYSKATGTHSHAGGYGTTANGFCTFAHGVFIRATDYQTAFGVANKTYPGRSNYNSIFTDDGTTPATIFMMGCGDYEGVVENALRTTADGTNYGLKAFQSSGADFAEYFEWADGNPDSEDRRGRFVTLDGEKIRLATSEDDYILGAVSTTGAFIGNSSSEDWQGKYMRDIFGEWLTQKVEIPEKVDEVTGEVTPAHTAVQYVVNPDYDPEQEYVSREFRKEWSPVGFHGQVVVVDDGTCEVNSYCKPSIDGIATASDTGYRVMARLDETHIKVLIR